MHILSYFIDISDFVNIAILCKYCQSMLKIVHNLQGFKFKTIFMSAVYIYNVILHSISTVLS